MSARRCTNSHSQTHTHRIIQILIVQYEKAGAAPLPVQYVISSAICMLWAVKDSGVRTAQEEHGCPSSFTLKSLLWPIHPLFFFSLLLCSFPWKMLSQIKPSTPNCSISSAVPYHLSLSSLCGIQPLKCQFTAAVFSPCHIRLLASPQCHQAHFHACADFTSFSVSVLLAVILSLSLLPVSLSVFKCLLFALSPPPPPSPSVSLTLSGLEAEVLDSQRRSTGLNDGLVNGVTDNSAN